MVFSEMRIPVMRKIILITALVAVPSAHADLTESGSLSVGVSAIVASTATVLTVAIGTPTATDYTTQIPVPTAANPGLPLVKYWRSDSGPAIADLNYLIGFSTLTASYTNLGAYGWTSCDPTSNPMCSDVAEGYFSTNTAGEVGGEIYFGYDPQYGNNTFLKETVTGSDANPGIVATQICGQAPGSCTSPITVTQNHVLFATPDVLVINPSGSEGDQSILTILAPDYSNIYDIASFSTAHSGAPALLFGDSISGHQVMAFQSDADDLAIIASPGSLNFENGNVQIDSVGDLTSVSSVTASAFFGNSLTLGGGGNPWYYCSGGAGDTTLARGNTNTTICPSPGVWVMTSMSSN
jgi:hypothetical protein